MHTSWSRFCTTNCVSKEISNFPHRVQGLNHRPRRWEACVLPTQALVKCIRIRIHKYSNTLLKVFVFEYFCEKYKSIRIRIHFKSIRILAYFHECIQYFLLFVDFYVLDINMKKFGCLSLCA